MDTSNGQGIIIKQEVCVAESGRNFNSAEKVKVETVRLIAEGGRSDGQKKAGPNWPCLDN
jgi:hypothetical protein